MKKSISNATQIAPSSTTPSSLPPSTATDQRSSPAMVAAEMNLDSSPAFNPTPTVAAAQVPTPPSIATTTDPSSARGRKRALEGSLQIENSNYYKIRLVLRDLRPHVLEVLRTQDFRNCKAAIEIKEKMKVMLELYKEMIGESPKREKTAKSESLSNGKTMNQTTTTEKQNSNGDGSAVVGGSAFGWNFITFGNKEAVYCGMSKKEYRKSHPITTQVQAGFELQKNTL